MLRTLASIALICTTAQAFNTPALNGLVGARMVSEQQVSRKQLLAGAATLAVSFAAGKNANAVSFDPNTGFPKNDAGRKNLCSGSADKGCQPLTQSASILDKQKAVLAGTITVAANKVPILTAAVAAVTAAQAAVKEGSKKKPAEIDTAYILRFDALYFTELKDAMIQYAARDAAGAKVAGGSGLPKKADDLSIASKSKLYSYVETVTKSIDEVRSAAKAKNGAAVVTAAQAIQKAAQDFLAAANPPVVFN